jgi:hypothetical protein
MKEGGVQKFWAVWRRTGGAPPSKRHNTKEQAIEESGRLANQTDEEYYILECIGITTPVRSPVNYAAFKREKEE